MNRVRAFGLDLGRALAQRSGPLPAPVFAPDNKTSITVDTTPMARALSGLKFPEAKAIDLDGPAGRIAAAIAALAPVELDGLVAGLAQVAARENLDLAPLVAAISANTAAITANTAALQEQTAVLKMDKTVTYDEQGRVTRVRVI